MSTGAADLDRRINETLELHLELQDRIAKVEHDTVRLEGAFKDLSGRVVSHLNSIQGESDQFIRNTETEFEAFRKLLIDVADEILRLSNVMERD